MNAAQANTLLNNYLDDDGPPDDPSMGKTMSPEEFKRRFGGGVSGNEAQAYMAPPMGLTAPPDDDVVIMNNGRSPLPSNHPQWDMETGWDSPTTTAKPMGGMGGVAVVTNAPSQGQVMVSDDPWGQAMPHNREATGVMRPAVGSDVLGTSINGMAGAASSGGYQVTKEVMQTPQGQVTQQTVRRLPGEGRGREQYQIIRDAAVNPHHDISPGNPMPQSIVTSPVAAGANRQMAIPKGAAMTLGAAGALGAAALLANYFNGRKTEEEKAKAAMEISNDPTMLI